MNRNPFTERGRITKPEQFVGRWREISLIFECIDARRPVLISGVAGIGKSSLLTHIVQSAAVNLEQPDLRAFYLDLEQAESANQIYSTLIQGLRSQGDTPTALELALATIGVPVVICLDNAQSILATEWGVRLLEGLARTARSGGMALIVALTGIPPMLSERFAEVLLPPVLALILAGPRAVLISGATEIAILLIRAGSGWNESTYATPDNLLIYALLLSGLVLSCVSVDSAQRLADINALAEQARQESNQRANELAERNAELRQLVDENNRQRDVIRELSIPLLPVAQDTLVMPLVGALDSARLREAQDRALADVHKRRTRRVVVDVTAVPIIDTQVAMGLVQLVNAVRLLGADVMLAGIRGEVAQTMVGLGVDLASIACFRDLEAALQHQGLAKNQHSVVLAADQVAAHVRE